MAGWEVATAGNGLHDRVTGLTDGGDNYVTKPFSMEEVMLRLHRPVQRSGIASLDNAEIVAGDRQPAP